MIVKDLMNSDVFTVSPRDTISSALVKMKEKKLHQLAVVDGNELQGMLVLKKIVTRDIDPSTTKVEALMVPSTTLAADADVKKAAEKLLISGSRALPVMEGGKLIGILSETDLMRAADKFNLDYRVEEIMNECAFVSAGDDVGKVKKTMAYHNVSRVPVTKDWKIIGVVGTLNLIDLILRREPMRGGGRGQSSKKIIPIDKTPVTSVLQNAAMVNKGKTINEIAPLLLTSEEVFVEDGGRFFVITPKDVAELIAKGREPGIYVQIANLGDVDPLTNAKIEKNVTEFVQKTSRMTTLQSFVLHVERHEKQGSKIKCSVRARAMTPLGLFVSRSWGWDLVTVFHDTIDKLEREIMKKHDKIAKHERAKLSKKMMREQADR